MSIKIVSDSSSNVFAIEGFNYTTVPMKVVTTREYIDTPDMNLQEMIDDLKTHKGKSGSSCPNVQEWLDAFGSGDDIIALTISRNLSGSYNSASQAVQLYLEENPGARGYVFDSLSAGPEQVMMAFKMKELIEAGEDFDTVIAKTREYHNHTHILFCLESLTNLARNGRVNPAVAKIAGMLGMRICGQAEDGQIIPIHKPRGHKKAMQTLLEMLEERGLHDGSLIRIAHCYAESQANDLKELVLAKHPNTRFIIEPTTALCSFYAEAGGLMIGFEGGFNEVNNNRKY